MRTKTSPLAVMQKSEYDYLEDGFRYNAYRMGEARAAVAELVEAARAMAGVQVNRRPSMRNDMGSAKKARLRAALAAFEVTP